MKTLLLILLPLFFGACDFGFAEVHSEMCPERIDDVLTVPLDTGRAPVKPVHTVDTVWTDCTKGHYYGPSLNPFN